MDEEAIDLENENSTNIEPSNVTVGEISPDIYNKEISAEMPVGIVAGETVEQITIDLEESIGWVGGDSSKHYSLLGREEANQHPIEAISGLREELDEIEALKTVYSDKVGVAHYYEWSDGSKADYGYFVSLVPHTSSVKICDGSDIFGVTVKSAGFIGGQDAIYERASDYALVAVTGLVEVQCESNVTAEDYVVSNIYGMATKANFGCGYKVIAIENKAGISYAVISLGVQACATNEIAKQIQVLDDRIDNAEINISAAMKSANDAYKKSEENSRVSDEAIQNALEAIKKAEDANNIANNAENLATNANTVSVQAKEIATGAVTNATVLRDEAINRANEAWAKSDDIATEFYSLCAKIDQYSVGPYSQAYNLTLEQAHSILEVGMIYVPTKHIDSETHKEEYLYSQTNTRIYAREFTPGWLYRWDYIASSDVKIGWVTVGDSPSVWFSGTEPATNDRLAYWYTDSNVVTNIHGETNIYMPHTLYKWEEDHWLAVATLNGNVNNRAVSEIYQTTNDILLGVSNPSGCIAALDVRVTESEATVQTTAQWAQGSKDGKPIYNIATIDQSADADGSHMSLVVADAEGNKILNGASIVLGKNVGEESYVKIDSDNIIFATDEAKFVTKSNLESAGETSINGGNITTGAIQSSNYKEGETGSRLNLEDGTFDSKSFKISSSGDITANGGEVGGWKIRGDELYNGLAGINASYSYEKDSLVSEGDTSAVRFYCGDGNRVDGRFVVLDDGSLYAQAIKIGDGDLGSDNSILLSTNNMSGVDGFFNGHDTDNWRFTVGNNFGVTSDGKLYARDADISGGVTAHTGEVGGWNIGGGVLTRKVAGDGETIDSADITWTLGDEIEVKHELGSLYDAWCRIGWVDRTEVGNDGVMYPFYGLKTNSNLILNVGDGRTGRLVGTWYIEKLGSPTEITSDKNKKNSIKAQGEEYSRIFDRLKPVTFKYNDGTSDRIHTGFIAQDIEDAVLAEGMTTQQLAAVCYDTNEDGAKVDYGVRYEEIVSMNTYEIQKLKSRVAELEALVAELKAKID